MVLNMHFCKAHARTLRLNTRCYELTPGPSRFHIFETSATALCGTVYVMIGVYYIDMCIFVQM
jgi:hypothetical protein